MPIRTIVFAKAPQPGLAKTRLIPALGSRGAARLARHMLEHTLDSALRAGSGPVELCVAPDIDASPWHEVSLPAGITITSQGGGDLGERMARTAARVIEGGDAALLIGTDCLEMGPRLLRAATVALGRTGTLLHPTVDGGYAILGLTRYRPELFTDIAWGGETVADETVARIVRLGWPLVIGATLHDIDEPADLSLLAVSGPPHAAERRSAGVRNPDPSPTMSRR
jgi:rSAM/selenodomain-associated transferase 1